MDMDGATTALLKDENLGDNKDVLADEMNMEDVATPLVKYENLGDDKDGLKDKHDGHGCRDDCAAHE